MEKRGQAATEFLTTYGWALLILAGIIAVIFSLNVFSPKVENTCIGSDPITCTDVQLLYDSSSEEYQVNLVLTASGVSTTGVTKVTEIKINNPTSNCDCVNDTPLINNNQALISCNSWSVPSSSLSDGSPFSGTAIVSYSLPGSTSLYTSKIIFSGTAEKGVVPPPGACQNN